MAQDSVFMIRETFLEGYLGIGRGVGRGSVRRFDSGHRLMVW